MFVTTALGTYKRFGAVAGTFSSIFIFTDYIDIIENALPWAILISFLVALSSAIIWLIKVEHPVSENICKYTIVICVCSCITYAWKEISEPNEDIKTVARDAAKIVTGVKDVNATQTEIKQILLDQNNRSLKTFDDIQQITNEVAVIPAIRKDIEAAQVRQSKTIAYMHPSLKDIDTRKIPVIKYIDEFEFSKSNDFAFATLQKNDGKIVRFETLNSVLVTDEQQKAYEACNDPSTENDLNAAAAEAAARDEAAEKAVADWEKNNPGKAIDDNTRVDLYLKSYMGDDDGLESSFSVIMPFHKDQCATLEFELSNRREPLISREGTGTSTRIVRSYFQVNSYVLAGRIFFKLIEATQ